VKGIERDDYDPPSSKSVILVVSTSMLDTKIEKEKEKNKSVLDIYEYQRIKLHGQSCVLRRERKLLQNGSALKRKGETKKKKKEGGKREAGGLSLAIWRTNGLAVNRITSSAREGNLGYMPWDKLGGVLPYYAGLPHKEKKEKKKKKKCLGAE